MFNRDKLRTYIQIKGLKQKFIAEKTHIPEKTLSHILTNKRSCSIDEYAKICIALDVSFEMFLGPPATFTEELSAALEKELQPA